jgi:hypothetical protein
LPCPCLTVNPTTGTEYRWLTEAQVNEIKGLFASWHWQTGTCKLWGREGKNALLVREGELIELPNRGTMSAAAGAPVAMICSSKPGQTRKLKYPEVAQLGAVEVSSQDE